MTTAHKSRLPPAKAWAERETPDWNTTTVCAYLSDKHAEAYGIPYVPGRGWRAEQGMIKRMLDEVGPEVFRAFIDGCFREYRPTAQYPALTFTFMYTYMRDRVLARVVADKVREGRRKVAEESGPSADEIAEWL